MRLNCLGWIRSCVLSCACACALTCPATAPAAGFVHNDNFMVFTPADTNKPAAQAYAGQVLAQAEAYRRAIALEWLGQELPAGIGRSVINVSFSDTEDRGLTWAKDRPDRLLHNVYLTTSRENAIGSALAHEVAHVVLASEFPHPNRLPAWAEEAIASSYDDADRLQTRQQIIRWYARTGNWPHLQRVLHAARISADDKPSYAAACSLADFLLSHCDKHVLLEFAQAGQQHGWNVALRQYYDIASLAQLQRDWQAWASGQTDRLARR